MAYGDKESYCEIFETSTDFSGREVERVISRWRAPGGVEPSLAALERQAARWAKTCNAELLSVER